MWEGRTITIEPSKVKTEGTPLVKERATSAQWCILITGRQANVMILTLAVVYLAVAGTTMVHTALPTAAAQIANDTGVPSVLADLPAIGSAVHGAGKLTGVMVASRMSPRQMLMCTAAAGTLLPLFFVQGGAISMWMSWLLWQYASSFTMPAAVMIIVNWIDIEHLGRASALLGAAWQGGYAMAAGLDAGLLTLESPKRAPWHFACYAGSFANFASFMLLLFLVNDSPAMIGLKEASPRQEDLDHPLRKLSVLAALKMLFRSVPFCFLLLANVLGSTGFYTHNYLPSFAVKLFLSTDASGASCSMYPLIAGLLLLPPLGILYDNLSDRSRILLLVSLSLAVGVMAGVLPIAYATQGLSYTGFCALTTAIMSLFLLPNYILNVVYNSRFGGPEHTGTIINLGDALGVGYGTIAQLFIGHGLVEANYFTAIAIAAGAWLASSLAALLFLAIHHLLRRKVSECDSIK
ncbi:hypothetical protein AB1Y20_008452 [Prymnesium parvum]|uniref:Major facilitator superfamily (MFS) profile domain-containing protein n=1 Tax=Prymnesium parvum TaxID=97485 RepID=A0AB34IR56_PRYPA